MLLCEVLSPAPALYYMAAFIFLAVHIIMELGTAGIYNQDVAE